MIKLHVTKKLLTKLPFDKSGYLPKGQEQNYAGAIRTTSPLSGWHANLLTLQRRNCILLVHDNTRFPLFIPCLTKPDFANLNWWFIDALMNTLIKVGANDKQLDAVHHYLAPLQIDTECNRSVQGTMSQMAGDLEHMLWFDEADILDLSGPRTGLWLSDRPCNVKGRKDCLWPQKAMLALLSELDRGNIQVEMLPDKSGPTPNFQDNVTQIKDYQK